MADETLFSRIAAGEEPSYTVYEDETTYAFLDINPVSPGHTLVIPREPYELLQEVPPDVAADLTATIQTLIPSLDDFLLFSLFGVGMLALGAIQLRVEAGPFEGFGVGGDTGYDITDDPLDPAQKANEHRREVVDSLFEEGDEHD